MRDIKKMFKLNKKAVIENLMSKIIWILFFALLFAALILFLKKLGAF